MVVAREPSGLVRHDQKHGDAPSVGRRRAVEAVKARQHHLQRRLHRQRARLQVDDPAEHARFPRGDHALQRGIVRAQAVGCGDQAALQRAGDKAAGVVVRSIGDSETLGVFNKRVAWKVVSQGNLVMLAFAREIQAAVLADAECAQPAQRSCKAVLGGTV